MGLKADVETGIDGVLRPLWNRRDGQVVPETEDINLTNGAVDLDATYLYADMADSTGLAQHFQDHAVAKVIRSYLNAATRIIRYHGGHIRSFDGDRVMGIFIGSTKNASAVKAAMQISWAVNNVINPKLQEKWNDLKWTMKHGVGIDTGKAMLVRGGVHGQNDIISIGSAPNVAAKLSEKRDGWNNIFITTNVYNDLSDVTKYCNGVDMWKPGGLAMFGGLFFNFYTSSYQWEPA